MVVSIDRGPKYFNPYNWDPQKVHLIYGNSHVRQDRDDRDRRDLAAASVGQNVEVRTEL